MRVNITDFGACAENRDNAEYIQKAIDSISAGVVVVPNGTFVSSTVYLRENITLYLSQGACLKAISDESLFHGNGFYDSFGEATNSFIIARNCNNSCICGRGMIDISGCEFVDYTINEDDIRTWGDAAEQIPAKPKKRIRRPILFDNCTNVMVEDTLFRDSPCWTLTFNNCRNVKVHGITVENNIRAPHTDGVHICGCDGVIIRGCNFTCGDDCVAITCLLDTSLECKNVVVSDCVMCSRSAAVRIGHMNGRIENVVVSNLCIHDTNRGLAIFASDGGYVKNIAVSNVVMDTHIYGGGWWGKGEPFVICASNSCGCIDNIHLSNIYSVSENIGFIGGNVENISIHDCNVRVVDSKNRRFAKKFDVAPNGEIDAENTFDGEYYLEKNIKIKKF